MDIYRKETDTDHYLQWSCHHPVHQKLLQVRTLMNKADTLIAAITQRKLDKEKVRMPFTAMNTLNRP